MDSTATALTATTLLEHEGFVRAIARELLADSTAADDVVQDIWVKFLERAPARPRSVRGWLARVTRHRASDLRREQIRRERREQASARPEATESIEQARNALAVQRDVVARILELEEPYRNVVILRYYHGLPHGEIARRTNTKEASVRTQLVRAHEILRQKLDAQYGNRAAWSCALVRFTASAMPRTAVTLAAGFVAIGLCAATVLATHTARQSATPQPLANALTLEVREPGPSSVRTLEIPLAAVTQEPPPRRAAPRTVSEVRATRAELLDRGATQDYEKATFSFERGIRDDPTELVRNDWDLLFEGGRFEVNTVVDDHSLLVDLGEVGLNSLPETEIVGLEATVASQASEQLNPLREGSSHDRQAVEVGHSYFVWTRDRETDLAAAFEVVEWDRGERCLLDWYATSDGQHALGSVRSGDPERSLASVLMRLRSAARNTRLMQDSRVVLQVRSNHAGGNPCRIDMAGDAIAYIRHVQAKPLDVWSPLAKGEDSSAYAVGGLVPQGKLWVLTRVTYAAQPPAEAGHRENFQIKLGDSPLIPERSGTSLEPIVGEWSGRFEVRPGGEREVYLEMSGGLVGQAIFEGTLEVDDR